MQKYQLVAHIKEGGKSNEWRLKCIAIGNPVHLKCNACDYYTNSVDKLRLHTTNHRHEAALKLYKVSSAIHFHWCRIEKGINHFRIWNIERQGEGRYKGQDAQCLLPFLTVYGTHSSENKGFVPCPISTYLRVIDGFTGFLH